MWNLTATTMWLRFLLACLYTACIVTPSIGIFMVAQGSALDANHDGPGARIALGSFILVLGSLLAYTATYSFWGSYIDRPSERHVTHLWVLSRGIFFLLGPIGCLLGSTILFVLVIGVQNPVGAIWDFACAAAAVMTVIAGVSWLMVLFELKIHIGRWVKDMHISTGSGNTTGISSRQSASIDSPHCIEMEIVLGDGINLSLTRSGHVIDERGLPSFPEGSILT